VSSGSILYRLRDSLRELALPQVLRNGVARHAILTWHDGHWCRSNIEGQGAGLRSGVCAEEDGGAAADLHGTGEVPPGVFMPPCQDVLPC
jgi:hypothetical protein